MIESDLSETRRILCDISASVSSFNNLLELKFLPRAVIERWMLARSVDEVAYVIDESMKVYMKLNSWQRRDARADAPRAVFQMLSTIGVHTDETILSLCLRFLTVVFEEHSEMFTTCVDLILAKILKYVDDQRLGLQVDSVQCLGVFITSIRYSALQSHFSYILGEREVDEDGEIRVEEEIRSENRLKLVTLAVLALNREITTGTSTLPADYHANLTEMTRKIVISIFSAHTVDEGSDGASCEEKNLSVRISSVLLPSAREISAALDLVAASSLVLFPLAQYKSSRNSSAQNLLSKKSFPSEFIESVLVDNDGVLRLEIAMQDEVQRRIAEKKLPSLQTDEELGDIADLLLFYVDNDNPLLSLPPALHKSLLLYIPAFETIDSLATTAESSSTISHGSMHTTTGIETSPLKYYSSSSNTNTPVSQHTFSDEINAGGSMDGVDSDIDRTKLSALKKSKSRGGSRKQRRVGSTSMHCMTMSSSDTADFFTTVKSDRSEGEESSGSRSPVGGCLRPKTFMSSKFGQRGISTDDTEASEGDQDRRTSNLLKCKDNEEFHELNVTPNLTSSFYQPNCLIDTLVEGDGLDAEADGDGNGDGDEEYDMDEFHEEEDESHIHAEDDEDVRVGSIRRELDPNPEVLAMAGETFLQGLGARTAEERTRKHEHSDSSSSSGNRYERSCSVPYPQTPVVVASYASNGMRTQGLALQGHTERDRAGKKSIAIAMSLARESRLLQASPSLPGSYLAMDSHEHKLGGPLMPVSSSVSLSGSEPRGGGSTQELGTLHRPSYLNSKEWDNGYSTTLLEPLGYCNRKTRTVRSPTNAQRKDTNHQSSNVVVPSSSSPKNSSSEGVEAFAPNTFSATKAERGIKGRERLTREQEDRSQGRETGGDLEAQAAAGQREYQLAGETFEYLSTEAIMPSTAPQKDLSKVLQGIGVHEWPEIFHTLTTVRRLSLHHTSLLVNCSSTTTNGATGAAGGGGNGGLHSVVLGVLKQVDNLRSAVAKNALLTLGDLFQGLGRFMDQEVALSLTHVLKRFADSSSFLVESAERALQQMMDGVSPSKSLAGLLTAAEHKAAGVRGKVASVLYLLWHQKLKELKVSCASGGKEQEALKIRIGKLVSDQTPEARAASRNIVRFLVKEGVVGKGEWEQCIPPDQLDKILAHALTAPALMGSGHRASKTSQAHSVQPPHDLSMDFMGHDSSSKCRNNAAPKNRHSTGGLARSPPTSASTQFRQPPSSMSVNSEFNETYREKGKGKGDKGVSFASDNESDCSSFTVQTKKPVGLYAGGTSGSMVPFSDGAISSQKANRKSVPSASMAAKRSMETADLQGLAELMQTSGSSTHWTERQESLKSISGLIITHWKAMLDAGRLDPCVDCLLERLEDGSVKVVHCALACMQRVHREAAVALGHSPARQLVVISALHGAASASNKQITTSAMSFLFLFACSVPTHLSIPHICAICLHEKERQRAVAFRIMADLLSVRNPQKDEILAGGFIKKNVFPTICQVLFGSGSKGEVRVAAADTLRALQQVMLSSSLTTFDRKRDNISERIKDKDIDKFPSEKNREKFAYKLYSEKNKENDSENKLLWTWCRDLAQQEEIKRLTANSV